LAGSISGVVFNDLDADGVQDGGDIGIAGQTVYIDTNANNVLDVDELSVVTGVGGTYAFTDLPTGTYRVKLNADPADTVTTPPGNLHNLPVQSGDVLTGNDFGLSQPATISGVVYADGDGDGTRDAGDPLQANITVYLD